MNTIESIRRNPSFADEARARGEDGLEIRLYSEERGIYEICGADWNGAQIVLGYAHTDEAGNCVQVVWTAA